MIAQQFQITINREVFQQNIHSWDKTHIKDYCFKLEQATNSKFYLSYESNINLAGGMTKCECELSSDDKIYCNLKLTSMAWTFLVVLIASTLSLSVFAENIYLGMFIVALAIFMVIISKDQITDSQSVYKKFITKLGNESRLD